MAEKLSESERLEHLHQLGILDTPDNRYFRSIAESALAAMPGASMAAISFVAADRQWFKTFIGADFKETPRTVSFCTHMIQGSGTMVVPDATKDERFAANPLVTSGPKLRFYAGAKLVNAAGGLCVLGINPRDVTNAELDKLVQLAQFVDIQLLAHSALYNCAGER